MGKKTLQSGRCANCGRVMSIKARGCCNNCYDTPMRKGYKPGSPEWIECQADLKIRFDPLFQPVKGRDPEKETAVPPEGSESADSVETRETDTRAEQEKKPITWNTFMRTVVDAGLAPDQDHGRGGRSGQEKSGLDAEKSRPCERYIRLFFDSEESIDGKLFSWVMARAKVNRRGPAAEIMFILEQLRNKDASLNVAAVKEEYSINTPDGKTVPVEGLTPRDKLTLGAVAGFVVGFLLTFFILYLFLARS